MKILEHIIHSFTNAEANAFKQFLNSNTKSQRNNSPLLLFNTIRLGNVVAKSSNKHQMARKRLLKKAELFILNKEANDDIYIQLVSRFASAKFLFNNGYYLSGEKLLEKVYKNAKEKQLYTLINHIQLYTGKNSGVFTDEWIEKISEDYHETINVLSNDVGSRLALSCLMIKVNKQKESFSGADLSKLLSETLKEFGLQYSWEKISIELFHILFSLAVVMFNQKKYIALEKLLLNVIQKLESSHTTIESSTAIDSYNIMLINAAWIKVKNKNYSEALKINLKLENSLKEHSVSTKEATYPNFFHCYECMFFIQLRLNNTSEAEKLLGILSDKDIYSATRVREFSYHINQYIWHFAQNDYSECLSILQDILQYETNIVKRSGYSALLIILISECILHYELQNLSLALSKIKSIRFRYKELLSKEIFSEDLAFLKILNKMCLSPSALDNQRFKNSCTKFLKETPWISGTIEFIDLNDWLLSKLEKKRYYEIFASHYYSA